MFTNFKPGCHELLNYGCRQSGELVELVGRYSRRLGDCQQEEIFTSQGLCREHSFNVRRLIGSS